MPEFHRVAKVDEIPPGGRLAMIVDDRAVLVLRVGNDFYAIEDACTHDGQPLDNGPLRDHEIQCPRHGARFDIKTGRALCMPAVEPVVTFEVKVENGEVYVGPEK
jgi:3-phenylpropionate/trans-cinnamate dioxygenase ferredoxin subunit